MLPDLRALTMQTLTDPSGAARLVLSLNLPRGILWQGLVLMAVGQAMLYALSDLAVPGPAPMTWLFGSPLQFFAIALLGMVLFVHALHLAGKMFGGHGSLDDVLAVMVWLQALRVLVQAAMLVLSLTIPILAMLLMLATVFIGLYITVHFINQALRLNSLLLSFFVMLIASVVIGVALSVLIALLGGPIPGAPGHV